MKALGFAMAAGLALLAGPVSAADEEKPMPSVDMATLMDHVITPAAYAVWHASGWRIDAEGEHDLSPQTDEEWEDVISGAAQLVESGHLLMVDERVLDDDWPKFVRKLTDAAEEAWAAAEAHDKKGIASVGDRLDEICTSCHKNYGYE